MYGLFEGLAFSHRCTPRRITPKLNRARRTAEIMQVSRIKATLFALRLNELLCAASRHMATYILPGENTFALGEHSSSKVTIPNPVVSVATNPPSIPNVPPVKSAGPSNRIILQPLSTDCPLTVNPKTG